jgi:hypothetical protein
MFFEHLIPYIAYLAALVICGMAIWHGDRPLKLAAAVLIFTWALTPIVMGSHKQILNYPITIIDTSTALFLVWASVRWRRVWCAVLAALTILVVIIPFVHLFDRDIHMYNRFAANNIVSNLQLVVVGVATWLVSRARRRADEGTLQP